MGEGQAEHPGQAPRALDSATQLQRKMEERRLRLQEAANRRFCSQVALTPEEREQRALFAAILEYEQDHVSLMGPSGWGVQAGCRVHMGLRCSVLPTPQGGHPGSLGWR